MSKKLKELMEFIKVHKKESIGVAVALGVAVLGVSGYAISKHYSENNTETNNIALAEKKEDTTKSDENKELDTENQDETTTDSDVVVEEQEDGTLLVKDKEGNIVADSSKGDDVTKIIAEKKEAGSNVAIKDKDGKVDKVDKIENGSITITGGGTVTVKPPVANDNTKPIEPSKPDENKPNNSTGGTESNQTPPANNGNTNNNPTPPVENNKPVDKPNNDNSTNNKPQDKPVKPTPPAENKPVEKPQEPVKPIRTWEYQSGISSELLNLISDFRQANGLNRLNHSGAMAQATKQHCEEMAQNGATFHKNDAGEWVQNVAKTHNATASEFLEMWKASSGHRQALLDEDITEGVCAIYRDSDGDYYAVFNGNF
ncbi:CAP domain-containing protein [Clostridium perfringens]|uniref:CAP domain-containing protein n=1 Tax=Clostridium perfringens TaxID=1502 RepID=UPI001ABACB98|nr:CAP domain-containing protein [Clostridium perfringens]MBO3323858.1 CAP domain-containing protein [Clostridium perfringens]MBO3332997.1 CAP domain-containing protein [Clostridium perfringens]MBO3399452.1 CAP domain-containing protein [Clostridium perfringens]MBO3421205.1 CAP domain-containing protein [Clostridium perfringens]